MLSENLKKIEKNLNESAVPTTTIEHKPLYLIYKELCKEKGCPGIDSLNNSEQELFLMSLIAKFFNNPIESDMRLTENVLHLSGKLGRKILTEGVILQADLPMELLSLIDSGNLPKFIVLGDGATATTYTYNGSSSPNLHALMTADKGVVGKIVYFQSNMDKNPQQPDELVLEIVKTIVNKKTTLAVGNVFTS